MCALLIRQDTFGACIALHLKAIVAFNTIILSGALVQYNNNIILKKI